MLCVAGVRVRVRVRVCLFCVCARACACTLAMLVEIRSLACLCAFDARRRNTPLTLQGASKHCSRALAGFVRVRTC